MDTDEEILQRFEDIAQFKLRYVDLQPREKELWDICVKLLEMGIKPTPGLINQAMGRHTRASLNGRQCRIKNQLLDEYGYEYVEVPGRWGRSRMRWVKKTSQ